MDIVFREITEDDLDVVLSIYLYYVMNTTATFHTQELNKDEMREIVFFENRKYKTYAISVSGILCGYIMFAQYSKRGAYGDTARVSIYLQQGYTGRGIGNHALRFIEEAAGKAQIHTMIAGICGDNLASIRLFEKNGYIKCAHYKEVGIKFGKRLDVLAYQKIIS